MESLSASTHWRTYLHVGALVSLVAAVRYYYIREFWITLQISTILIRCAGWFINAPLQMIEPFLILSASQPTIGQSMFWSPLRGNVLIGEAGQNAGDDQQVNKYVTASFSTMRFIVTVGWSIYPLGYFFGYLLGSVNDSALNLVYNLADLVNKIGFCLAIWQSAKNSTLEQGTGNQQPLL